MTKKDGDKLRDIREQVYAIAAQYDVESTEAQEMLSIGDSIGWLLRGYRFTVQLHPSLLRALGG